jgi:hypothetical protein
MNSIQVSNKFKNLSILLLAKEEHKRKFGKIHLGNTIANDIRGISHRKLQFIWGLRDIMEQKYHKYITERKITIPNLEGITQYNCETDCPVCMETIGDNTNGCMEGDNCNHTICSNCRDTIVSNTNKCPICRKVLDENIEESDTESEYTGTENSDTDDDDWRNEYYGATNIAPTTNLFLGRRWYNAIENRMYYWQDDTWIGSPCMDLRTFIERYNNWFRIHTNNNTCCNICGIQKTLDVNSYMKMVYNLGNDGYFEINNVDGDEPWEHYFGGNNTDECYDCYKKYEALSDNFNVMTNDAIWEQD